MSTTLERPIDAKLPDGPILVVGDAPAELTQRPTLTETFTAFWNGTPTVDPEPPPVVDQALQRLQIHASYYGLTEKQVTHLVEHFGSVADAEQYLGRLCYCSGPRASFIGP